MWKLAIIVISTLALQTSFIECEFNWTGQYDHDCGRYWSETSPPRIAGGKDALPTQFPSYVTVLAHSTSCGGVIITPEHILTSAHCLIGLAKAGIFLRILGDRDREEFRPYLSSKICVSKKARITPGENFTAYHDVAIVKLKEPLPLSEKTWPACLMNELLPHEEVMYTVGHGVTENGRKSERLQFMPMLKGTCVEKDDHESIICTRPHGSGGNICLGDSGAGLYRFKENRQYVVGINSYTYKDCSTKEVGLPKHAHVFNLLGDIKEMMQECK